MSLRTFTRTTWSKIAEETKSIRDKRQYARISTKRRWCRLCKREMNENELRIDSPARCA